MEALILRVSLVAFEAVIVGAGLGGVLLLIRKIQIQFGMKEDRPAVEPQVARLP